MKTKLLLFALILSFACAKNPTEPPPPPSPDVNGTWNGSGTVNNIPFTFTVTLAQTDTTVTGSGTFSALFLTIPFNVAGSCVYPVVGFSFASDDSGFTGTYTGVFDAGDDNKINGFASVPSIPITNQSLNISRTK